MSIEISGPQGFEYQYLITLRMAIDCLPYDDVKVLVENDSFEDAELSFQQDKKFLNIDLQVKQKEENISFEEFCGWISHFQSRSSETFILEKIQNIENNYLVFVTNNRCMDKVSKFLWNRYEIEKCDTSFSDDYLKELKDNILKNFHSGTGLQNERYVHIEQFFMNISNNELRKILRKIRIIERKTEQEVIGEICNLLKLQYYIPETECANVIREMLDTVKKGRDTGYNIAEELKRIIEINSGNRILPYDDKYCKREKFDNLKNCLDEKNVLLLTGVPFSGKTYLAKSIAQKFQEEGFFVKRTENIISDSEGYHFLWAPENDKRLLLLEDPFGHIKRKEEAQEILDKILVLVREIISSNRKLIITTRKDILFEVYKKSDLQQCNLLSHAWWDTTVENLEEMRVIWEQCYGVSKEVTAVFESICDFLHTNSISSFLEIGEIRHLYTEFSSIEKLQELSVQQIINCARISAEEVCRKISSYDEEFRQIFIRLGCYCDTIRTISMNDLAYILLGQEENVSIRENENQIVTVSLGRYEENKEKECFPTYKEELKLTPNIMKILRELCRIGYLYKDHITNVLSFVHPMYVYASQKLLSEEIAEGWDIESILGCLRRGISSLSRNAAICCLSCVQNNFTLDEEVIKLFFLGINSIFPSVRDKAVTYLDQNFDKLDSTRQVEFMKNIRSYEITDSYIEWNNDECWYPKSNSHHRDFWDFTDLWGSETNFTIKEIETKLMAGAQFSKKEIYTILHSGLGEELPLEFLEYALLCEENVIRSKALYYIFKIYAGSIGGVTHRYLDQFENHNVVYSMLKGTINNWNSFRDDERVDLVEYFKVQLQRKSVALYTKKLFENFGIEYKSALEDWTIYSEEEKIDLWKLWAELFSTWLRCFPAKYMGMDEPHMITTTNQSLKYLANQNEIIEVGMSWLDWLSEYSRYHRPNDYGMSVLEYILNGTKNTPDLRSSIIQKSLEEKNSNIITSHIAHLVRCWNLLEGKEKELICEYLKKNSRIDYKWIQAVAIVQENVPHEIQKAICNEVFLDKSSVNILEVLESANILEECLSMFCGFPQPLWFNGYHHCGKYELWDNVITEVLKQGAFDKSYYIALREFMDALYNDENHRFKNGYATYLYLIDNPDHRGKICERLAYLLTQNQDNKKMWDDLLKVCTTEEKMLLFQKISKFVEIVEMCNDGYGGLLAEFDYDTVHQYLLPHFSADKEIIDFAEGLAEIYRVVSLPYVEQDEEFIKKLRETYLKSIEFLLEEKLPQLRLTHKIVKLVAKKMDLDVKDVDQLFEENKNEFWKRYDLVEKSFQENCPLDIDDEYQLKNWQEVICGDREQLEEIDY